jgi:prolipoprotein diacylglyceryltransferase
MPLIQALERLRQENLGFKAHLVYKYSKILSVVVIVVVVVVVVVIIKKRT